jgi:hypothetical protein
MKLFDTIRIVISIVLVFTLLPYFLHAESGIGCVIEGSPARIYITEFGDTNWYGDKYKVYNRNGNRYYKVYNPTTTCGETNAANIQPYTRSGYKGCWVSDIHNPNNNDATVGGYGAWVTYTNVTPCQLPIDDYVIWLLPLSGVFVYHAQRRKVLCVRD